ncbi:DUF2069 domain-containing protein [Chitinilyticum piscinae]|uniref:DUF2069 domain-containing protein n=1 Tax=Chitinilyticum piscinae TaxID=2866724 RepID=A0A8J7FF45_9NEIS|nr:DUF2069 domain-containing protein [Chitinilyticum piscinae]MBE9607885.1 DUF2069 domain-containing protein [Chitinilyticum piscinae]
MDWRKAVFWQWFAVATLLLLVALCLAWELWLAPLRPGGSWLVLKVAPLLLPLRGMLNGRRYTFQWFSMAVLLWFTEGVMRAYGDHGVSQMLALAEILLSVLLFMACNLYSRLTRPSLLGK